MCCYCNRNASVRTRQSLAHEEDTGDVDETFSCISYFWMMQKGRALTFFMSLYYSIEDAWEGFVCFLFSPMAFLR